jgi:hypothetical protein
LELPETSRDLTAWVSDVLERAAGTGIDYALEARVETWRISWSPIRATPVVARGSQSAM